jgi:hypothetical protein
VEAAEREGALDAGPAGRALEACDIERFGADRASRDHRIRHEAKMLAHLIESQAKLSDM